MIKVCDLFGVSRYSLPNPKELQYHLNILQNEINQNSKLLSEIEKTIQQFIEKRAGNVTKLILLYLFIRRKNYHIMIYIGYTSKKRN